VRETFGANSAASVHAAVAPARRVMNSCRFIQGPDAGTNCSTPLRALAHAGKCRARPGNHLGRIERRELAAALENAAVDHDRVDVFRAGRFEHEMRGVGHDRHVERIRADRDQVRALAGRERTNLVAQPMERAPSMVPSSSALRAVILNSLSALAFSQSRASLSTANRFELPTSAEVSTEIPSGMPLACISLICG